MREKKIFIKFVDNSYWMYVNGDNYIDYVDL